MKIDIAFITETKNLEKVRIACGQSRVLGADTETTSLSSYDGRIRTLQLSTAEKCFVMDLDKLGAGNVAAATSDIILDPHKVKVMQNGKFDIQFMHRHMGLPLEIPGLFDTMLASQLITAGGEDGKKKVLHGLDSLAERYLGMKVSKKYQKVRWDGSLFREQILYAGMDAAVMIPLYRVLSKNLSLNQLDQVALLEFECVAATAHIEQAGMHLDKDLWLKAGEKFAASNLILGAELKGILGNINFGSWQQVLVAFEERLGVKLSAVNKTAIEAFIDEYKAEADMFGSMPLHDVPDVLRKYQEYKANLKKESSYGPDFFKFINKVTGRIHPSFGQNNTDTGRYSVSNPNTQQTPGLEDYRRAFTAEAGNVIISSDYSQIELRILAATAGISSWIKAFDRDEDLHQQTADAVGCTRAGAKVINFGSAFGMGAASYSAKTKSSISSGQAVMKKFYASVPEFTSWLKSQEEYFQRHNLVRSASGRMRRLDQWGWSKDDLHAAKQASRNFPIQATSADILKTALVKMRRRLPIEARIVNVVHDEVVTECPIGMATEVSGIMETCMIEAGQKFVHGVEIKVDTNISKSWNKEK